MSLAIKSIKTRTLVIVLALLFLLPVPIHSAQKHECSFCHLPHYPGGMGMKLLKEPVNDLCLGCHPGRKAAGEHLVDIAPSVPVGGLPLGTDGKITCITCHDPHGQNSITLLRIEPPDLCLKCHQY